MTAQAAQGGAAAPPLTFPRLLGRLVLAGVIAGLLAGTWLLLVTEPFIRPALEVEEARELAAGIAPHPEEFTRITQQIGGAVGMLLAGLLLGVVFAVVYALVRHRLPGRSDLARVTLLAGIGFGVVGLLPAIKIPANPPAVGNVDTVTTRTLIYGGVLLCGIVITMLVAALVSLLQDRRVAAAPTAAAATLLGLVLATAVVLFLPDTPDVIPADVPAKEIWNFRLVSLGQQAVLWTAFGLAAGWLLDRVSRTHAAAPTDA